MQVIDLNSFQPAVYFGGGVSLPVPFAQPEEESDEDKAGAPPDDKKESEKDSKKD